MSVASEAVGWGTRLRSVAGRLPRALLDRVVHREGSTRVVALLRIGLCALFFTRFGHELGYHRHAEWFWWLATTSFIGSTTLLLVGFLTPLARAWNLFTVGWMYFGIAVGENYHHWRHHNSTLLFLVVALLSFTPCGRSFSVDQLLRSWWVRRTGERSVVLPERGFVWGQYLIALQASAVYFWGAYDKLSWPYLSGARLEHHLTTYFTHFDTPDNAWFHALMCGLAVASVLLELALAFLLFHPRLWWPLAACGAFFHIVIYFTLPVSTFSATIIFLYLAYVDPDRFHDRMRSLGEDSSR